MNSRKRALPVNSQVDAETQAEMKKLKGSDADTHVQPQAATQEWDMEVDSNYAAQEHRYDESP